MNKIDLRLKYKYDTGNDTFPSNGDGDYLNQPLKHPYFKWMEEQLLDLLNEK